MDFTHAKDRIDASLLSGINSLSDLTMVLNSGNTGIIYSTAFKLVLTGDYTIRYKYTGCLRLHLLMQRMRLEEAAYAASSSLCCW